MDHTSIPTSIDYTDIYNDVMERKLRNKDYPCIANQLERAGSEGIVGTKTTVGNILMVLKEAYSGTTTPLQITPHAESMLLSRLKIPGGYFHRCPEDMQVMQMNYWLTNNVQSLCLRIQDSSTIRAVFGKRFKDGLDDNKVIPVFIGAMEKQQNTINGDLIISSYQTDSHLTYLSTILTGLQAEHNNTLARAGVALINSEVGHSALHIRPVVFNKRYFRWMDFYAGAGGCTSLRHTRDLPTDMLEVAVLKAVNAAQVGIQRLFETMHEEVRNPVIDLKKIIDSSSVLSARVMDGLIEDYEVKELTTKYQIAEDILLACKDLPLFKQHVAKVEVGRYLNLFSADEARMNDILDD